MNTYIKHIVTAVLLLVLMAACTKEELNDSEQGNASVAQIIATIGESSLDTKATPRTDDPLSYKTFADADKIGFYSKGGLDATNKELILESGLFKSSDLNWGDGYATDVFAYFPYSSNANELNIWKATDPAKPTQLEDVLIAQPTNHFVNGMSVSLGFKHAFSMLIIMRGKGFETASGVSEEITVTMSQKVKTAKVVNKDIQLNNEADGEDTFIATKGNYDDGGAPKDAWFVIIPSGSNGTDSIKVKNITLYKSDGSKEVIEPKTTITPQSNFKYPITALVNESDAIIQPHEIRRWTDETIEITKPAGIYNATNLRDWYTAYNSDNSTDYIKYGDQKDGHWTFYLRADLSMTELSQIESTTKNKIIDALKVGDTFDGCGYTFSGLELTYKDTHTDVTGFVGTIEAGATLKNLTLEGTIINGKNNVGALAGINQGKITNCKVTGVSAVIGSEAKIGGLVGDNQGVGAVENCKSSAMVAGRVSVGTLVGTGAGTVTNSVSTGTATTN